MHSYNPIILSQPIQSKKLYRKGNVMFRVGAATMQGWRVTMEDAHSIQVSLPNHPETGFFAVYDGHGGTTTSQYLCENFHKDIDQLSNVHCKTEILKTAVEMDTRVMSERNTFRNGSTAVFGIVSEQKHKGQYLVTIGNIGDSRAVLIKNGKKGVALTKDHIPTQKRERARILRAGGVVNNNRVRGELAVSRSFGDAALKLPTTFPPDERMVIPVPDLKAITVSSDDILVLTCDGLYEKDLVFNVESLSKFIIDDLRTSDDIALTCARLLDATLERRSYDNMTVMMIQFKEGSDYHQEEIDFRPGPFHEGARHTDFKRAYISDAKLAGYTLKQARMKFDMALKHHHDNNDNNSSNNNLITRVQRRNSESEVLLSSKEKFLSDSGYESDEDTDIPNPKKTSSYKNTKTRRKSEHLRTELNSNSPEQPTQHTPPPSLSTTQEIPKDSVNDHSTPSCGISSEEISQHSHHGHHRKLKLNSETDQPSPLVIELHSPKIIDRRKSPLHHLTHHQKSDGHSHIFRRHVKSPDHSDDDPVAFTSDNEHISESSNENSPTLSRNTSNGNIFLPKILHHHRKHPNIRKKESHPSTKTPSDPVEVQSSHEHSPRDHELTSDEDTRLPIIISQKKKVRKNRFALSHDEISREESEDGSCDHDTTSDLSDSHPKKHHHFHFPSFHSLWSSHKKPHSNLIKKERDGEHSNGSEHDNDTDRSSSSRRLRESDSQSKRHNISHRFILIDPVEGPNVNTHKN